MLSTLYIVPHYDYVFVIGLSTCRRAAEDALSLFTPSRALNESFPQDNILGLLFHISHLHLAVALSAFIYLR